MQRNITNKTKQNTNRDTIEVYFNDLWVFNTGKEGWEAVTVQGVVPSRRWSHVALVKETTGELFISGK